MTEITDGDLKQGGRAGQAARRVGLATVSSVALLWSQAAYAQTGPGAEVITTTEELIVTGSRVVTNGYNLPTPVTVIGETEIQTAARPNLADFVHQLPSIVGSTTPATTNASISDGGAGINSINLRGLGNSRTLVLLDGHRTVGSTITGTVDVNTFPQGLVKSVEIVTGGASAAYGSDAVSGVANFILDKTYRGFKLSVEGGETTYGDDKNWRINSSAGADLLDGRAHVLLNGEVTRNDGVFGVPRKWNKGGVNLITNPAYVAGNGQPEWVIASGSGPSTMTPGGIIVNTALRGTYFGQGGAVGQLVYGQTLDPDMIGGDWKLTQVNDTQSLHSAEDRYGAFGRFSFNFTSNIRGYVQASWNRDAEIGWGGAQRNEGGITIRTDNAFLPASVRARAVAANITQFTLGSSNGDLSTIVGNRRTNNDRKVERYMIGFEGEFMAAGTAWKWDTSYQAGIANTHEEVGTTNNANLALAQDAVFNPAGQIVCRSTLTAPTNGCIPFNRLGVGVNGKAAVDYVLSNIYREQTFRQNVATLNFSTSIPNKWFNPIGLAFGGETRREAVSGFVPLAYQAGWFTGNYLPTFGHYNVTEGYVELNVPITKRIEFNGAARKTHYSVSGNVTTWKGGVTWNITDDLKLRGTRSRDIRAPNLSELFAAGTRRTNTLVDPFSGNASVQFLENTTGNLALKPEVASSISFGAVYRPSFVPRLGLSVDYYNIKIDGAIGTLSAQAIVDRCFSGVTNFCTAIVRGLNANGLPVISQVNASPFNFARVKASGIDFEASYSMPVSQVVSSWGGNLALRGMATHYIDRTTNDGVSPPTNAAGQNASGGTPSWVYRMTASYSLAEFTGSLTGRGFSSGKYNNAYVTCTSGCPASTVFNRTVNTNSLDGAFYVDGNVSYKFEKYHSEVFFSVNNILNTDPVVVAQGVGGGAHIEPSTNAGLYDYLGRTFRVGVRFEMN